jgi:GntR family transcriptional regulator
VNEDAGPIFRQVAARIENAIVDGSLAEETQAPSSNELAAFHRINPATAAKGLNQLVTDGVLYKRRGVGMFVATGAREQLLKRRRSEFRRPVRPPADDRGTEARHLDSGTDHDDRRLGGPAIAAATVHDVTMRLREHTALAASPPPSSRTASPGYWAATAPVIGVGIGVVQNRWGQAGTWGLMVASLIFSGGLAILITWLDPWSSVASWFGDQSVTTLAVGLPAPLAAVVALVSYGGIRRVVP